MLVIARDVEYHPTVEGTKVPPLMTPVSVPLRLTLHLPVPTIAQRGSGAVRFTIGASNIHGKEQRGLASLSDTYWLVSYRQFVLAHFPIIVL